MDRRKFIFNSALFAAFGGLVVAYNLLSNYGYRKGSKERKTRVEEIQRRAVDAELPYVEGRGYVFDNGDLGIFLARDYFKTHNNRMRVDNGDLIIRIGRAFGKLSVIDRARGIEVEDVNSLNRAGEIADVAIGYVENRFEMGE